MPPADRAKNGPDLARQLEDLLDDTPFDITMLSRDPEEIRLTAFRTTASISTRSKSIIRLWNCNWSGWS